MKEKAELTITSDDLETFRHLLSESMGLYFPIKKSHELETKLKKVIQTFEFNDAKTFLKFLTESPLEKKHIVTLAKDLSVGETYFFRHTPSFHAIEHQILPSIIQKKREEKNLQLKIWSAACCTGEEPYSIAILLDTLIPDRKDWDISIFGTDINLDFLKKAQEGVYKDWSFRGTPASIKARYFKEANQKKYILNPQICQMVEYFYLNLVEASYPSIDSKIHALDLILCNHVLIYFTPEHIQMILKKLSDSLSESGWLMVSSVEVPFIEDPHLTPQKIEGITFFKKAPKVLRPTPPKKVASRRPPKNPPKLPPEKPSNVERLNQWKKLFLSKKYSQVIEEIEKNFDQKNDNDLEGMNEGMVLLANAHANQGNILRAREWCEKGLQIDKVNPLLHYLYAMILQELDEAEAAIHSLKSCLFLDPTFIMAHFSLGSMMLQAKQSNEARKHFQNALELTKNEDPERILQGSEDLTVERLQYIIESLTGEVQC